MILDKDDYFEGFNWIITRRNKPLMTLYKVREFDLKHWQGVQQWTSLIGCSFIVDTVLYRKISIVFLEISNKNKAPVRKCLARKLLLKIRKTIIIRIEMK